MAVINPIPLNGALLVRSLGHPDVHREARAHMMAYIGSAGDASTWVDEEWSLLRIAACNAWVDEACVLLGHGADVHEDQDWCLRHAACHNNVGMLCLLLAAGADVHAANNLPLSYAAACQNRVTTGMLLAAGADVRRAVEGHPEMDRNRRLDTIDACAAAIPADQRQGLSKLYRQQMPILSALLQGERRRTRRQATQGAPVDAEAATAIKRVAARHAKQPAPCPATKKAGG